MRYTMAMSKEALVMVLGALIFLTPFMGIPREHKEWFFIGAGIVLMIIGYRLRRLAFLRSLEDGSGQKRADAFTEHDGARNLESNTERQDLQV